GGTSFGALVRGREPMRRPVVVTVVVLCLATVVSSVGTALGRGATGRLATTRAALRSDARERRGSDVEPDQQATSHRLDALAQARANGQMGTASLSTSTATTGW